ncbi:gas vesicle protein [Candidatus Woesearchaeota archaeon]|nr:gas vesicle protein [Candidatus Woesearchaeota archaeon]
MGLLEIRNKAFSNAQELLNKQPESVSLLEKTEKGWRMEVEVLERKAIPDKFDLLSVFELNLDSAGNILSFKQIRKIIRGDVQR